MTATTTDRARDALGMDVARRGEADEPAIYRHLRAKQDVFAEAVASGLSASVLVRDALTALRTTKDLVKCGETPAGEVSFFGAVMTAAQLGLRPNVPTLGHGWILPSWNGQHRRTEARWQLGYQGMVELAYRSGLVRKITAHTIYEGEPHRVAWGTEDVLLHEPRQDLDREGAPMLWHYAVAWLSTGGVIWSALTDAEVQQIRDRHGPRNRNQQLVGPWVDHYAPQARKTALRSLWRWMPKSRDMSFAINTDDVVRVDLGRAPDLDTTADDDGPESAQTTTVTRIRPDAPAEPDAADSGDEGAAAAPSRPEPEGSPPEDPPDPVDTTAEPPAAAAPEDPANLDPWPTTDGGHRDPLDTTKTRQAYMARIAEVHGERFRSAVETLVGEWVPPRYLTTPELRALANSEGGAT